MVPCSKSRTESPSENRNARFRTTAYTVAAASQYKLTLMGAGHFDKCGSIIGPSLRVRHKLAHHLGCLGSIGSASRWPPWVVSSPIGATNNPTLDSDATPIKLTASCQPA
jgi:hypothetical protein